MHQSLDEFVFQPDLTTDYGDSCPGTSKNQCFHFFSDNFKLADNQDMHNHTLIVTTVEVRL